jgi:hypothetical protein
VEIAAAAGHLDPQIIKWMIPWKNGEAELSAFLNDRNIIIVFLIKL